MPEKLEFQIIVDDDGTPVVRRFSRNTEQAARRTTGLGRTLSGAARRMLGFIGNVATAALKVGALGAAVVAAAGAFAAWKLKNLAASFLETGVNMDKLRLSLDTITKGRGEAWFKRLNEWALKMPINTAKAIGAFTMMRAMGLKPTIKDMTTLVDTTSALGGSEDVLEGIARALGQMAAKGKVSAEELMQLAERGVPAAEILREKLGLTGEQVADIGNEGVAAGTAITALLEGMAERFGGQSAKIQNTWGGMMETLKGYWTDFKRLVMDSGVMQFLEENLRAVVGYVDELHASGKLQDWAQQVSDWVVNAFKKIRAWVLDFIGSWDELEVAVYNTFETIKHWVELVTPALKAFLSLVEYALETYNRIATGDVGTSRPQAEAIGNELFSLAPTPAAPAAPGGNTVNNFNSFSGLFIDRQGVMRAARELDEQRRRLGGE